MLNCITITVVHYLSSELTLGQYIDIARHFVFHSEYCRFGEQQTNFSSLVCKKEQKNRDIECILVLVEKLFLFIMK